MDAGQIWTVNGYVPEGELTMHVVPIDEPGAFGHAVEWHKDGVMVKRSVTLSLVGQDAASGQGVIGGQ